ncbi:uncharacterized protein LOC144055600 [Vanacampus margaritifer]
MTRSSFLLVALACAMLALECRGRIVSRCELRNALNETIKLSKRTQHLRDVVVAMLVCRIEKMSQRNTGALQIYGQRVTAATPTGNVTAATPTGNATVASAPPANQNVSGANDTDGSQDQDQDQDQIQDEQSLGEDQGQEEEAVEEFFDEAYQDFYDEEGEYFQAEQETGLDRQLEDWLRLMELLNEEENQFDEEMLVIADDQLSADDDGLGSGSEMSQTDWSLGHYGLFQLSDSYFCQSSARWSRNVCQSPCAAFTDDDISDDLNCFTGSLYWLYVLRMAGHQCYKTSDFFSDCA